jgi:hypothetical protein
VGGKAPDAKSERVGHPEVLTQFIYVEALKWFHPIVSISYRKDGEGSVTRRTV